MTRKFKQGIISSQDRAGAEQLPKSWRTDPQHHQRHHQTAARAYFGKEVKDLTVAMVRCSPRSPPSLTTRPWAPGN